MAGKTNFAICASERAALQRHRDNLIREENRLGKLEESIRVIQGEINYAENALQRVLAHVRELGSTAVGCVEGLRRRRDPSDCVSFAIRLSREQAAHEEKIRRLRNKLGLQTEKRNGARQRIEGLRSDIQRTIAILKANGCR